MPISDRTLVPGTRLTATHKQEVYELEVLPGPEGKLAYRLGDGRVFRSPSAAGKTVMGGVACNGWRFWSRAEEVGADSPTSGDTVAGTATEGDGAPARPPPAPKRRPGAQGPEQPRSLARPRADRRGALPSGAELRLPAIVRGLLRELACVVGTRADAGTR